VWDALSGISLKAIKIDASSLAWHSDGPRVVLGGFGVQIWDVDSGALLRRFEEYGPPIGSVAWSPDERCLVSGSADNTVRIWDVESGQCLRVLEGHRDGIMQVAWSDDQRYVLSGSNDGTMRLWDVETGGCLHVCEGRGAIRAVAWGADGLSALSGDTLGEIRIWDLSNFVRRTTTVSPPAGQLHYMNAKFLLVGDSGAGKTGLSKRLASNTWGVSDPTVGAWATQRKLPVAASGGIEREIWLGDFWRPGRSAPDPPALHG
jgi:WD40 repeat protein